MTSHCCAFNTLLLFDLIAATSRLITTFCGKLEEADGSPLCVGQHACQRLPGLLEPGDKGVYWKISFSSGIFSLRTVLTTLLPNICNHSLIYQEITASWEVSSQNWLLPVPLLSLLLILEVFVEAKGYLSWIRGMDFTAPISAWLTEGNSSLGGILVQFWNFSVTFGYQKSSFQGIRLSIFVQNFLNFVNVLKYKRHIEKYTDPKCTAQWICIKWTHLCKLHSDQETKQDQNLRNLSVLLSYNCYSTQGSHYLDFWHHTFVLLLLEFHATGFTHLTFCLYWCMLL